MEPTQSAGNHMSLVQYFNTMLRVNHNLKMTRSRHKAREKALASSNLNTLCKAKCMLLSLLNLKSSRKLNLKYAPCPVKLEEMPYTRPLY